MTERTVAITRTMPAPRERVFEAWTQARHLECWFAPRGFSLHSCVADARPGGEFRMCMRSPEGKDYWEVTLAEEGRHTRLELLTKCSGRGEGARRMVDGMPKGWSQTLARLQTQFDSDQ